MTARMFALLELKTLYILLNLLGVTFGAGGALAADIFFLSAWKDRVISSSEGRLIRMAGNFTWLGITFFIVSGALLFAFEPEPFLTSSKFLAEISIMLVIVINAAVIHLRHLPLLLRLEGVRLTHSALFFEKSGVLFISAAISIVSWLFIVGFGIVRFLPYSYTAIMTAYGVALIFALLVMSAARRRVLGC